MTSPLDALKEARDAMRLYFEYEPDPNAVPAENACEHEDMAQDATDHAFYLIRDHADALIAMLEAHEAIAAKMDGCVMVPREPTAEMQAAGAQAIRFATTPINKLWTGNAVYRAMLTAYQECGQ